MDNFESLVRQHHGIIYKICRVYSTAKDFDDLYQEVLINIWKGLKSFKGQSKLSTWLYRVVLNTALTYQRNQKKHRNKVAMDAVPELPDLTEQSSEKEAAINRLYAAINQLKKEDRFIILLYLEEKSYNEIAEITGLSLSNIGVKINRIKKKLLTLLNNK